MKPAFPTSAKSAGRTSPDSSSARVELVATGLAFGLATLAVAATIWRIFYGADFIDEAFYAALAYRFAMGTRPFVEQVDPHQMAGLLVAPYVKLHLLAFGDTTGIMLSLRLFWVALNGLTATLWYLFLRSIVDRRLALLSSVAGFVIMPYMIPAPSFNTLPIMLGAMALALAGSAYLDGARLWAFGVAGMLLGLASFAYPTLIISSLLVVAGVLWLTRSWREPVLLAAGGLGVAVLIVLSLGPFLYGLPRVLEFSRADAASLGWAGVGVGGAFAKVVSIVQVWASVAPMHPSLYLALALGVLALLRKPVPWPLAAALVISLPFALEPVVALKDVRTLLVATSILVAALVVAFTTAVGPVRGPRSPVKVMRLILGYGLVTGVLFAATSSNHFVFLGLGASTVLAPSVALLFKRLHASLNGSRIARFSPVVSVALAASCLLGFVFYNTTGAYRDLEPFALHTIVKSGPHAGLVTTPENAAGSEALWTALKERSSSDDRLLCYHGFPAGYLYTAAKPSVPQLWLQPAEAGSSANAASILRTVEQTENAPTIVIRNLGWPNSWVFAQQNPSQYDPARDALDAFVRNGYRIEQQDRYWQLATPIAR